MGGDLGMEATRSPSAEKKSPSPVQVAGSDGGTESLGFGHDEGYADSSVESIEVEVWDHDSSYGDELQSMTTSLSSTAYHFVEEHGRTYHSYRQGRYKLPNDEIEADRLDIHHALVLAIMHGELNLAPIAGDIESAIDLGTGTGIWAMDFADAHPNTDLKANDLTPVQQHMVPPKLEFIVDDIEDEWLYEHTPFDYVHGRFLAGAILNWPRLIQQAYTCTKPLGWVEFQEWDTRIYSADGTLHPSHSLQTFHNITSDAHEKRGFDMSPGKKLQGWLRDAGFINIVAKRYVVPLGMWAKDKHYKTIGAYNFLQMKQAFEGIALGTLTQDGWTVEECQILAAKTLTDAKDPKIHSQYDFYVVYGQKPAG
ncbi:S-adenosyl-L-methionine-dependent methyltransferase [Trichodelitschia bisporula]|uniref:S-adenosyl-L-methionine-dependent methyltransferase n=1 Tax=Trichodelitschia bisporula TaxID=703511 RepID=A0A6G1I6Q4_9PEZI|nr:S-adenosyl-L-methionine-dependent methyltransferase [Trichodelitschia bisporula]